jgi:hypothetical protein
VTGRIPEELCSRSVEKMEIIRGVSLLNSRFNCIVEMVIQCCF